MARAPREQTIETYPEADRLGDFPHPRFTETLFGHRDAEAALAGGLADAKLHHAWLLVGPTGIGKATLAYRFAKAALNSEQANAALFSNATKLNVDENAHASHLVRALSHPDLLVIRRPYDIRAKRFKTAITVDEVRRLRDFLGHKQTSGGSKVVIVDAADDMNINAANALLKSLEEPPPGVVFLLIASMPGRLLTTIRSRCRILSLSPLGEDDLKRAASQALSAAGLPPVDVNARSALSAAANGSVAKLLGLASDDGIALADKVELVFDNLKNTDWSRIHQLADEFSAVAAGDKFETFSDLLLTRLARLIRVAATEAGTSADQENAKKLGIAADLASWAELWETLVREKTIQNSLNLDRKAFVIECVMRLRMLATRQR